MIDIRLKWHPQFSIYHIENDAALFLGEDDQYLIDRQEFEDINRVVRDQGLLSDYVFGSDNLLEHVNRIERIDSLIADKVLLADVKQHQHYSLPGTAPYSKCLQDSGRDIYLLSEMIDEQLLLSWLASASLPEEVSVVVVDDYLNPDLSAIDARQRELGRDWLVMKPLGQTAMIGPVFSYQHADNAPCYQCLLTRLIQNNPVREWCRRHAQADTIATVPVLNSVTLIKDILDNFEKKYLQAIIDNTAEYTLLYSVEALNMGKAGRFHYVMQRPQCPGCGDPGLFATENNTPLNLNDSFKHQDNDGGYRVLSRDETIAQIDKLISPITGIITGLTQVSEQSDIVAADKMQVYQATYFQNTYHYSDITADTFLQLSLGKGVSPQQARSSALGEALERQAAQYNGEESFICATVAELTHRVYLPQQLTAFSTAQLRQFSHFSATSLNNPQWLREYKTDTAIHWVRGWSLTHAEFVYFPAAFCFANTPYDDHVYSLYTHNGNAAGNTKEEAILQGALELIERDAAAIWWYNQVARPEITLDVIPDEHRTIIDNTLDKEWDYWLLDISTDIDVICCVAVGRHKLSGKFVLGFGCHLDVVIAGQRALSEMFQLITIKNNVTGPFDFNLIMPHPFLFPRRDATVKNLTNYRIADSINIKDDIFYLIEGLRKANLDMCVVNYSRPDIVLKTLKVIVPGLCHFWPQLATSRLYEVPVKLGWLSRPLQENELNPLALYL